MLRLPVLSAYHFILFRRGWQLELRERGSEMTPKVYNAIKEELLLRGFVVSKYASAGTKMPPKAYLLKISLI